MRSAIPSPSRPPDLAHNSGFAVVAAGWAVAFRFGLRDAAVLDLGVPAAAGAERLPSISLQMMRRTPRGGSGGPDLS